MSWSPEDSDIEGLSEKLLKRETIIKKERNEIREWQQCIKNIRQIQKSTTIQVPIDHNNPESKTVSAIQITYSQPVNPAGDEMPEDIRTTHKTKLIKNINKFLGE